MYYDNAIRESEERFRKAYHNLQWRGLQLSVTTLFKMLMISLLLMFGYEKVPVGVFNVLRDDLKREIGKDLSARRNWGMHCELRGITQQGKSIYLEATTKRKRKGG